MIATDQVLKGFINLLTSLPDLVLDVPEAPELLTRFVTRAVVDDVLPPAIVSYMDPVGGRGLEGRDREAGLHTRRRSLDLMLRGSV